MLKVLNGSLVLLEGGIIKAPVVVGIDVLGIQLECTIIIGDGSLVLLKIIISETPVVVGIDIFGV